MVVVVIFVVVIVVLLIVVLTIVNYCCFCVEKRNVEKTKEEFEDPAKELFLWCILMHMQELALLFWHEGKVCN